MFFNRRIVTIRFKKSILIILLVCFCLPAFANHIAGGELFYEYVGPGVAANSSKYKITMRLFRDCFSNGQTLDAETVTIGIYNQSSGQQFGSAISLGLSPITTISLNTSAIPCLINAPNVCFQVGLFSNTVELTNTADGYTLIWIRCCRSDNIVNLTQTTGAGATFSTNIPGTTLLPIGNNSSPQFLIKDTALVCKLKPFVLDFGATDADGDSLSYSFCAAYNGGTSTAPNPGPSASLDLNPLGYRSPYSGTSPLGPDAIINPRTGKITGTAPVAGRYVVNVCVTEWRNGVAINVHRKDFILQVGDCDYAASNPLPQVGDVYAPLFSYDFVSCKSFKVNFINNNGSTIISSYNWDFGVAGITTDTSTKSNPSYTFPDTGFYRVKLIVKGINACADSNTVTIGIFPGFQGNFDVVGTCYKNPFVFTDKSTSTYGFINTWKWDFGDASTNADTSTQQNTTYKYPFQGARNATLYVTNSKGCRDTVVKQVIVRDIPYLFLPFHDTLICTIDTLPLIAQGSGIFSWTPNYNIINPNTATPLVYPKDTTTYVVTLLDRGCTAIDSIKVNTLDFITVDAGRDTIICRSDIINLNPFSYGLQYQWQPTSQILGNPNIKYPEVSPAFNDEVRTDTTVTYFVTANLGKCQAKGQVKVKAVRYPQIKLDSTKFICFNEKVQLNATIKGNSFTWFPTNSLINFNTLSPTAAPSATTTYTLTVTDTIGCPKPSSEDIVVNVTPKVIAFAGNDTNIVANQPLQLNATGGTDYTWTPTIGMNNPFIYNPIVVLGPTIDSITYTVKVSTPAGCFATDKIKVVVFKTAPDIFVPSGFTPNGDGKNDILRPIAVGLKKLDYFRVYNRWGQLLYATSTVGEGWNGSVNGKEQATGTFVYSAQATDYMGKTIFRKGTVVLIR